MSCGISIVTKQCLLRNNELRHFVTMVTECYTRESFEVNSTVVFWDLKRKDAFVLARQFACVF
jgi:hypothetical protein